VLLALVVVMLPLVTVSRRGLADGVSVPAELQVELLSKLSTYDRSFASRAGDVARILIVTKPKSAQSDLFARMMKGALSQLERFGGLPHTEVIAPYESATALAARCRSERIAVVYVTPGFGDDVEAVRTALDGVDVLTVAALPEYVPSGIVLGFELLSGKPKMLINYEQAKRQNVSFAADVLKLMKVVSR